MWVCPKGKNHYTEVQSLTFGTNSCPSFSAKSYIVRRRRVAALAWRRPLLKLTRFSVVHILHTEELLVQERPRRHQGKGGRQRRLLCRRGIALVAACGSGAAHSTAAASCGGGSHQPQPHCERPLLQLRQHRLSEHPHYVRNFVRYVQQF